MRVADHREQRLRLRDAVDDELGVEDLVAAVLGVRLREHHQLDIGRIAPEALEGRRAGSRSHRPRAPAPVAVGRSAAPRVRPRAQCACSGAGAAALNSAVAAAAFGNTALGHAIVQRRAERARPERAMRLRAGTGCRVRCAARKPVRRRARYRWPCSTTARWCRARHHQQRCQAPRQARASLPRAPSRRCSCAIAACRRAGAAQSMKYR